MQHEKVKVTVIIPGYNIELYLSQALESIVNQTLKEIDLILVDDGSTDKTGEIMDEYAGKYPNIRVVHQENHGVGHARNVGLGLADGEFIYFIDGDDWVEPDTLEELYNCATKETLDMVLFNGDVFNEKERKNEINGFFYTTKGTYPAIYEGGELFSRMLDFNEYRSVVALRFIRSEFIKKEHIRFMEGIIHEDEWFSLQTMLKSHRVKHIDKMYFHRRLRSGSIMMTHDVEKSFYGYMITLEEMCKEYKNNIKQREMIERYAYLIMNCVMRNYVEMKPDVCKKYQKEVKELKHYLKDVNYFSHKKYRIKFTFLHIYAMFRRMKSK